MPYRLEFRPSAAEDMRRLDKAVAQRVMRRLKWLTQNVEEVTPEGLTSEFRGLFKMRVGSYRVIYNVNKAQALLTVHFVGHRRQVYKRK